MSTKISEMIPGNGITKKNEAYFLPGANKKKLQTKHSEERFFVSLDRSKALN